MRRKQVHVAERIRILMLKHELTQEEFAEKVDMPFPTVRELIYGRRKDPKLSQLIKMSAAFSLSLDEFVFGKKR